MFRILTEDRNRDQIIDIVKAYYDGFTVIPAIGVWKGEQEKSLIIEISVENAIVDLPFIRQICHSIKGLNYQDAVLFQLIGDAKSEFIS